MYIVINIQDHAAVLLCTTSCYSPLVLVPSQWALKPQIGINLVHIISQHPWTWFWSADDVTLQISCGHAVKNVSKIWPLAKTIGEKQLWLKKHCGWKTMVDVSVWHQFDANSWSQFHVNSWHHNTFIFNLCSMVRWHQLLTSCWCQFHISCPLVCVCVKCTLLIAWTYFIVPFVRSSDLI